MKKIGIAIMLLLVAMGGFVLFYGKDAYNQYALQDERPGENDIKPGQYVDLLSKDEFIEQISDYYDIKLDKPKSPDEQAGVSDSVSVRLFIDEVNKSIHEGWENRDFSGIDLLTQRFLSSPEVSRAEKIYVLWSIIGNTRTDFQYRYFVDALSSLSPVELADEIIDAYYSAGSTEKKIGLLRLMETFPDAANPSVQTEHQLQYVGEQMVKVRGVLEKEIQANDNELIFEESVSMYERFAPENSAVSLLQELFVREDLVLGQEEKLHVMIGLSFGTHERQNTFMPQLLREIGNFEPDGSGDDNEHHPKDRYVALLADFKREWMSNDVVPEIREFLEKNEPGESDLIDDPMKYEYWVRTSIRYGVEQPENEAAAMTDFIFGLDDPVRMAALTSVANQEVTDEIMHDERLPSLVKELQSALQEQNNMSASKRELIMEELDRIRQDIDMLGLH